MGGDERSEAILLAAATFSEAERIYLAATQAHEAAAKAEQMASRKRGDANLVVREARERLLHLAAQVGRT